MKHVINISRWTVLVGTAAILGALTGCDGRHLISDQAMIDHFNAHKQEFNELTQSYLDYGRDPMAWAARQNVVALKDQTGIDRIIDGPGYWFDDPYSLEAAHKLKEMNDAHAWGEHHDRKTVLVKMADTRIYWAAYLWNGGLNWKDFVYFPEDPAIESGRIKWPRELRKRKISDLWLRVIDSLDSPEWERGECVLRKIEPKWFICRCRAN